MGQCSCFSCAMSRVSTSSAFPVGHIHKIQCGHIASTTVGASLSLILGDTTALAPLEHLSTQPNSQQPMRTHKFEQRRFVYRTRRNVRLSGHQSFAFFVPATPVMTLLLNKKSGYWNELFPPPRLPVLQAPPSTSNYVPISLCPVS